MFGFVFEKLIMYFKSDST